MPSKKKITFTIMKNIILALLALNCLIMALLLVSIATMKPEVVTKPVYINKEIIRQQVQKEYKPSTQAKTVLRIIEPKHTKTTVTVVE